MSTPLSVMLIGANGQVSTELQRRLAGKVNLHVVSSTILDLTQPAAIREQVRALRPGLIINPAAHTAVDKAESEPELAFAINGTAPGVLAEEAALLGAPLIHYSTDYVFDGNKASPYVETDPTGPLGVYGQTKLAGEQAIQAVGGQHLILRTSWVYAAHGRNFLLTMQRLMQEKPELKIVADQYGAPTWAGAIAHSTVQLIERWQAGQVGPWGVYHLTAEGSTSWFGFAQAIGEQLRAAGKPCANLLPIPASDYPTPAKRPVNSRLDCSLLAQQWGVSQADWHSALLECLGEA
jgi:dTDP-4-dehydrorhamnose reductase